MTRVLRITAEVPIPADIGEKAALLAKAASAISEMAKALGVHIDSKEVTIGERKSKVIPPEPISTAPRLVEPEQA